MSVVLLKGMVRAPGFPTVLSRPPRHLRLYICPSRLTSTAGFEDIQYAKYAGFTTTFAVELARQTKECCGFAIFFEVV